MRRTRARRDADGMVSNHPRAVSLAQFRREVVGLLVAGRRYDADRALRLLSKWDAVVRTRWTQGKPPCNVADHIARYEKEGVVCPCGSSSASRDPEGRCGRCRRRLTRKSRRDVDVTWDFNGKRVTARMKGVRAAAIRKVKGDLHPDARIVNVAERDPECILLDENANDYGTGDRSTLMRKGKPGQSVMCRAKNPRDLVDVHAVRDPERRRSRRTRRSRR